jgi:MFS family permease
MKPRGHWSYVLAAAAILLVTMGSRQSQGLFVAPLAAHLGLGVAGVSLAMAIGQLAWGVAQPVLGAAADRWGPGRVIVLGAALLACGSAGTTLATGEAGLVLSLGLLSAIGAGAGSFSVLMGASARHIAAERRSFASGFINAGGSMGQFVLAPLFQAVIAAFGWAQALWAMALLALSTAPMAWWLRGAPASGGGAAATGPSLGAQLRQAFGDRSYWCLLAGFFTCGFHIAFLVTHLPGEVGLCGLGAGVASASLAIIGLSNVAGSLAAGALGSRVRMKMLLFWMYATRALAILAYLAAPKDPWTFYVFAAVLGLTWLATVPPTAGLTAKLFGTRYLATLFGMTLLAHQVGGFFGAWLGGVAVSRFGSYAWMWWADAGLALSAAFINLPIREARPFAAAAQAA